MNIKDHKRMEKYSTDILKVLKLTMENPTLMQRATHLKRGKYPGFHYRCGEYKDGGIPLNGKLRFNVIDPSMGFEIYDTSSIHNQEEYIGSSVLRVGKRSHDDSVNTIHVDPNGNMSYLHYKRNCNEFKVIHDTFDYASMKSSRTVYYKTIPLPMDENYEEAMFQLSTTDEYFEVIRLIGLLSTGTYIKENGVRVKYPNMMVNLKSPLHRILEIYERSSTMHEYDFSI